MRYTSVLFTLLLSHAATAELTIFDVRRNLPLSDAEKIYHDYLVDGGVESGLKVGMQVMVSRRLPIYDYYRFRSVADLQLKVAKVKVIAAQEGLSVVRPLEDLPRETNAVLDDNAIMIGDKLDLTTMVAEATPTSATDAVATVQLPVPAISVSLPLQPQIVVNSVEVTMPAPTPSNDRAPASKDKPSK